MPVHDRWPNSGTQTPTTTYNNDLERGGNPMLFSRRRGSPRIFLARYKSYIFLSLITLLFLHQGFYSGHNTHPDIKLEPVGNKFKLDALSKAAGGIFGSAKGVVTKHPIPGLMDNAEDQYRIKLRKQSKTLKDAVEEYRKRYNRSPPKGFDEWWAFAQENNVKMVDEFDGLMTDLEPFWKLSGEEIRRRTLQVGELPSIHLVRVRDGVSTTVKMNHAYEDSEVSARAHGFRAMITKFESKLPDMDFAINAKAEGRVLIPWEHQKYSNMTIQDSSKGIESVLGGPFVPDWNHDENIWEAWRRTCPPDTPARRLFASRRNPFASEQTTDYLALASSFASNHNNDNRNFPMVDKPGPDFKFMPKTNTDVDFCLHPHMHSSQGHFYSDWRSLSALYPVFTPARTQGFMDIRIPSHYYYGSTKRYTYGWDPVNLELKDVDAMEVPWEDKLDKVFWRGATTGGGSHPPGFAPQYQRHRFLRMTSPFNSSTSSSSTFSSSPTRRLITFADPPNSNRYITASVPLTHLNNEIMDVAFVKAVAAESYPGGEEALLRDHRFSDSVPLGEHWKYRYLVDLDGMSYSGRFLAFLASDSVPIKSTVYEEWFSDWIQPWVHFIPLSTTYKEIYNILAYFSGPTPSTLLAANSSLSLSFDDNSVVQSTKSESVLSEYALKAIQNQEVLRYTKQGRELLRNVDAERRLKRIARAGKEWKKTMGRKVDMEAGDLSTESGCFSPYSCSATLFIQPYFYLILLPHFLLYELDADVVGFLQHTYIASALNGRDYGQMIGIVWATSHDPPHASGGAAYMARSPSINDFQIEKVARTPAAKKSFPLPPESVSGQGYSREEMIYRESVSRLLDVKARQFAVAGRIPYDANQLVLFFRSKSGITHSLDFPINVLEDTPPALDVLIAACRPHQTSDLDAYGDRESLFFPPNLPLTTSLEIANHPILDAVRSSLFPSLPQGHHLFAARDKLEVVVSGGRMGRQPISLRNDGRSATIIITLPVRYRGGAVIVTEPSFGDNEKFAGRGGKNGDLDWVAFLGDCDYEIETVQSGCRVSISYGVYIKGFNVPVPNVGSPNVGFGLGLPGSASGFAGDSQGLITPSDRFFDFLSPILNMSRGKKLGFFLNYSYNSDPSEVVAETLIPQLKGGDALLYQAFKMYKLSPELQWTAGGYVWPTNMTIQFPTEDITNGHPSAKSLHNTVRMPGFNVQRGYGVPSREEHVPPVRGAFGSPYHTTGGHELGETEADILRIKVEEAGGIPLADAEIQICTELDESPRQMVYGMPKPNPPSASPVGVEHVYFISAGELEKLVVNTLLVIYIP
ncbi:hypothetical protein D9756_008536 [Leucocoprinus leucothites]|uniref:Glycosyl transferase CAP10 domain-containing protein n=1 Tax=Leucocoprinus leucothites TaxID=201217 RepID=A0A8H5FVC6_9AGAR|nr:hypothetical protein D9756_008536 [Leucoagaricus leucothites]